MSSIPRTFPVADCLPFSRLFLLVITVIVVPVIAAYEKSF
jgi:hypothetical protein